MAAQGSGRRLRRGFGSGKLERLAAALTRYGKALRADFQHHYGLDIGELWRRREVERALDLIEHLPPTSHYAAAVHGDDELAEYLATQAPSSRAPPLTEWSAEVQQLTVIADVLNSLRAAFLQANGAKGVKPPPPQPRPVTAAQRWKRAQREAVQDHIMSRLLPGDRRHPRALTVEPSSETE